MTLRSYPPFTITPDADAPTEHEERNRGVLCRYCSASTWNVHGACKDCLPVRGLTHPCDCAEGRLARGIR